MVHWMICCSTNTLTRSFLLFIFEPRTGTKLLHDLVMEKVDSRHHGQIVASFESIVQREVLAEKVLLIIISGLPNATKSATYYCGEFVLIQKKMNQREVAARTSLNWKAS